VNEEEGFIEVPGGKVWYRAVGDNTEDIPLLCLHGGPGFTHYYLEPLESLAEHRRPDAAGRRPLRRMHARPPGGDARPDRRVAAGDHRGRVPPVLHRTARGIQQDRQFIFDRTVRALSP